MITKKKKAYCIVQARVGSERFPNKVLEPIIEGNCSLDLIIKRIRTIEAFDIQIIIATTENKKDDAIVEHINKRYNPTKVWRGKSKPLPDFRNEIFVFRGSEPDVLKRVADCAMTFAKPEDAIIDITGDCPFVDPEIVESILYKFFEHQYDYFSNVMTRQFPDGFDVQVYKCKLIDMLNKILSKGHKHRLHTGWSILAYSELLQTSLKYVKFGNYYAAGSEFNPSLRLVLDYVEDLHLMRIILEKLGTTYFNLKDVLKLLEKESELLEITSKCYAKIEGDEENYKYE